MKGSLWSPEDTERLGRLLAAGSSASKAAAAFPGRSRNAILGHADRQGFRLQGSKWPQNVGASKVRAAHLRKEQKLKQHIITATEREQLIASTNVMPGIMMKELKNYHCRYPLGEIPALTFCGNQKTRGTYCEAHWAIAYKHGTLSRL